MIQQSELRTPHHHLKLKILIALTVSIMILAVLLHSLMYDARNYREEMRNLVQSISTYGKETKPDFIVIPQNGPELLTTNGEPDGPLSRAYLDAIDGVGREALFYGYASDNIATPASERNYLVTFMDAAENNGVEVLVTDYCLTHSFVDDSYTQNAAKGYMSFAADHRELDNIPAYPENPYNFNDSNVTSLAEAKNFLYLINPGSFTSKDAFLGAVKETNYDVIIIDLFYDGVALGSSEVASLRNKANGGFSPDNSIHEYWRGRRLSVLLADRMGNKSAFVASNRKY